MKKWSVFLTVDANTNVIVEAETEEEALQKGLEAETEYWLCHQCSRHLAVGDVIEAVEALEVTND